MLRYEAVGQFKVKIGKASWVHTLIREDGAPISGGDRISISILIQQLSREIGAKKQNHIRGVYPQKGSAHFARLLIVKEQTDPKI
jgi:hypothetical protein